MYKYVLADVAKGYGLASLDALISRCVCLCQVIENEWCVKNVNYAFVWKFCFLLQKKKKQQQQSCLPARMTPNEPCFTLFVVQTKRRIDKTGAEADSDFTI